MEKEGQHGNKKESHPLFTQGVTRLVHAYNQVVELQQENIALKNEVAYLREQLQKANQQQNATQQSPPQQQQQQPPPQPPQQSVGQQPQPVTGPREVIMIDDETLLQVLQQKEREIEGLKQDLLVKSGEIDALREERSRFFEMQKREEELINVALGDPVVGGGGVGVGSPYNSMVFSGPDDGGLLLGAGGPGGGGGGGVEAMVGGPYFGDVGVGGALMGHRRPHMGQPPLKRQHVMRSVDKEDGQGDDGGAFQATPAAFSFLGPPPGAQHMHPQSQQQQQQQPPRGLSDYSAYTSSSRSHYDTQQPHYSSPAQERRSPPQPQSLPSPTQPMPHTPQQQHTPHTPQQQQPHTPLQHGGPPPGMVAGTRGWKCKYCTFTNDPAARFCAVCSQPQ